LTLISASLPKSSGKPISFNCQRNSRFGSTGASSVAFCTSLAPFFFYGYEFFFSDSFFSAAAFFLVSFAFSIACCCSSSPFSSAAKMSSI
jgi:dolichyl-phosphate-mannose--protein O-mannosyl transferase